MTGSWLRIVSLPGDAFSGDEAARDRVIKATIIQHYENQHGSVPAVGAIPSYAAVLLRGYGGFDFGLPFFYGRRVAVALEGSTTSAGTGPYLAF